MEPTSSIVVHAVGASACTPHQAHAPSARRCRKPCCRALEHCAPHSQTQQHSLRPWRRSTPPRGCTPAQQCREASSSRAPHTDTRACAPSSCGQADPGGRHVTVPRWLRRNAETGAEHGRDGRGGGKAPARQRAALTLPPRRAPPRDQPARSPLACSPRRAGALSTQASRSAQRARPAGRACACRYTREAHTRTLRPHAVSAYLGSRGGAGEHCKLRHQGDLLAPRK